MNSLLPLMTNQIAFDTVLAHLIKQGKQAIGDRDLTLAMGLKDQFGCMYKAPNGCMCAVGVLIPEDMYETRFEGKMIRHLLMLSDDLRTHLMDVDTNLLRDLQAGHDMPHHWDDQGFNRYGLTHMYKVAGTYKLEFNMPEGVRV